MSAKWPWSSQGCGISVIDFRNFQRNRVFYPLVKNNLDNNDPHGKAGDPLWDILGNATETKPGPAFVQNVLRTIRTQPDTNSQPETSLHIFLRWLIPAAATAVVAFALTLNLSSTDQLEDFTSADLTSVYVEAAGLEDLLASSADWAWQDVAP